MKAIAREPEIRAALVAHPELTDRQIGKLLDIRLWSKVRLVREAVAAEEPAPPPAAKPPQILADDVPAASDAPARQRSAIAVHAVIVCANCGREGTPADADPTRCKACHAGGAEWRARWPTPPRSAAAEVALALLSEATDPAAGERLRRRYLRARAVDWKILEVKS
jgi:hypothetical protein